MDTATAPPVFDRLNTLGDTTRSRLLALLEEQEFSVGELCQVLQLPQSTVSRHLRILADAGWIRSRAEGTSRLYRMEEGLDAEALALWRLVRGELTDTAAAREDRERARSVTFARRDRSRAFFSASAEEWDQLRDDMYGVRADLLPLFGLLGSAWTVADLGCGTGKLAGELAPFVRAVRAVDRSPEMLAEARARLDAHDNVEVCEAELEALPLETASVDLAILSLVLHVVVDPPAVLAEAARILRPEGRLVVVEMRAHERLELREEMGHLWPGFEAREMRGWLERAGFEEPVLRPLRPDPEASGPLLFVGHARRRAAPDADHRAPPGGARASPGA